MHTYLCDFIGCKTTRTTRILRRAGRRRRCRGWRRRRR